MLMIVLASLHISDSNIQQLSVVESEIVMQHDKDLFEGKSPFISAVSTHLPSSSSLRDQLS